MSKSFSMQDIRHYFSTKSDTIKWVLSVGVAAVLAIIGIVFHLLTSINSRIDQMDRRIDKLDHRIDRLDDRLTQEIRDLRKEMRENHIELSQKIDLLLSKK